MPLFFSRRRFLNGRFNKAASDETRHVAITGADARAGRWQAGFVDAGTWAEHVLAQSSSGHVLIYVHGYNTTQRGMLTNLGKIRAGLSAPYRGAVVGFDWPSDGDFYAYNWDRRDIERVASSLVDDAVLPLLKHRRCKGVSVLAHSRGSFLTLRALSATRALGGKRKLSNVLFIAADVRTRDIKQGAAARKHLHRTTRRVTNYYSRKDTVLFGSRVINGSRPRMGRSGLPNPMPPPHSDVLCDLQYVHEHGSSLNTRLSHNWYFSSPAFYRDASLTLAGKPAASLSTRKRAANSTDHVLWVR